MTQFEHLTVRQVELLFDGPALVALLIAGSDGKIDQSEINRAIELVHIKTFSERADLQDFYKELEPEFARRFNNLRQTLPNGKDELTTEVTQRLEGLNEIFMNLPYKFAHGYYKSLKNYAVHIANASGGFAGVYKISDAEKELMQLPMLNEPTQTEEE